MPRKQRLRSPHDLYHIVYRGNNKQVIFGGKYDYLRYYENLLMAKSKIGFEIHAYCFMNNHVHLLVKIPFELMPKIALHVNGSYAHYFNRKTGRTDHLFGMRYGSIPINTLLQYKNAVRYIHQNPIFADIIRKESAHKFPWSSYGEILNHKASRLYFENQTNKPIYLSDTEKVLSYFNHDNEIHAPHDRHAYKNFKNFHSVLSKEGEYEYNSNRITDQEALELVKTELGHNLEKLMKLPSMTPETRNKMIQELLNLKLPIAQIVRITGVGKNIISRIKKS